MTGNFKAYYLNEQEYKSAIELDKVFKPHYTPYLIINIVHHFDAQTFEGVICNGTEFIRENCLTVHNGRQNVINIDYDEKKVGTFTFDGISFFRIINKATKGDQEGLIFFTFKYLDTPSFTERNTAFMIMPFKYDLLNEFYKRSIKGFLNNCDLNVQVYRSDDFVGTDIVSDTIIEQIKKAEFIIADITNCNKNVFFEIGYARAIKKDIVFLLEQNRPADFFDINHIRRIEYSHARLEDFQKILHDTLINIRQQRGN